MPSYTRKEIIKKGKQDSRKVGDDGNYQVLQGKETQSLGNPQRQGLCGKRSLCSHLHTHKTLDIKRW